jgi:YVTN family beta-propeller protein
MRAVHPGQLALSSWLAVTGLLLGGCQDLLPGEDPDTAAPPAEGVSAEESPVSAAAASTGSFVNFEGAQTSPMRMSADGTRLYVVNTPDARLAVYDLATPSSPRLIAEIPVGIEPVSVTPRTSDEVWVVNQVSDSISIVSVSQRIVTDTIYVEDEPADVVFAGSTQRAYVSVSRLNQVQVFDVSTHARVATIALSGANPRALATSADGSRVYAAFALAGNRTTITPAASAPPPPPPTNPSLPAAPQTGLIVDATDPSWTSVIRYTMPDNDVAEISTSTNSVSRYFTGVGTTNLGIAVRPGTGEIYVANTEARNLVRFEPNVRGHIVDNRVTRMSTTGAVTAFDLNPGINYSVLPNTSALSTALAQPAGLTFEPGGAAFWVAAFGTDRVARVDAASGNVLARVEIGNATGATVDPRNKRGPRGLALHPTAGYLYVANRLSNTLSVVSTGTNSVVTELGIGAYDPTPAVVKTGRGFLYDAKLSGNGTAACAACHIDGDDDLIAWDLGDPGGSMQTVATGLGGSVTLHPMKGPMTTQTLRGLAGVPPYHWRGDRADFTAFNGAFASLMGGAQLSSSDMTAFRDFINTVVYPGGNPNRGIDNSLPTTLNGGSPSAGLNTYQNEPFTGTITCQSCHTLTNAGTNGTIIPATALQESQAMKVGQLRNLFTKTGFNRNVGAQSVLGFGFTHDGAIATLFDFLSQPVFGSFSTDTTRKTNLAAFVLCFDTGIHPAIGYSGTVTSANVGSTSIASDLNLLESLAAAGTIDLIVKGTVNGVVHGLLYQPSTSNYTTDQAGLGPFTRSQLASRISAGDRLTYMAVPHGAGRRMGIDRDENGVLDFDQSGP